MIIQVCDICNQKCVFCSFSAKGKFSSGLKVWLKELEKSKDKLIQISGGEPFLADTDELVKFCAVLLKRGKIIEFQTNAAIFEEIEKEKLSKIMFFVKASKGYFNINFSSSDEFCDRKITKVKGNFSKRLKNLKKLLNFKVAVRLTFVINAFNFKKLPVFAELVAKKKLADRVQFSFVKGKGAAERNLKIIPSYEDVSGFLIEAMDIFQRKKINFEADHIPPCHLGVHWKRHVDLLKVAQKKAGPYETEKVKTKSCSGCRLYGVCSGVRKDYLEIRKFKKGRLCE